MLIPKYTALLTLKLHTWEETSLPFLSNQSWMLLAMCSTFAELRTSSCVHHVHALSATCTNHKTYVTTIILCALYVHTLSATCTNHITYVTTNYRKIFLIREINLQTNNTYTGCSYFGQIQ